MTAGVSVMAWVKPSDMVSVQTVISRSTGPAMSGSFDVSHGYSLRIGSPWGVEWEVDDPSTAVPEVLRAQVYATLNDGGWHHVAATWEPGSMAVFVDGVEVARQVSQSASINPATSTPFMIGGEHQSGFGFTGSIDEPMLLNRAIAATEIAACVPPLLSGTISTVAGNGTQGFSGDGGPATDADLSSPFGVAVDAAGNLYIADFYNNRVRKVSTSGTITTVAGNGTTGFSGDGGPATNASLYNPAGVAVDAAGNLYIADTSNERVRKVSTSGTITTVAGDGTQGFSGDGGPATNASLNQPYGVAVDAAGNLYIADTSNGRVRKVSTSGTITTIAGNGTSRFLGDGGPATDAGLTYPQGVAVDAAGNVYIADPFDNLVRKVSTSGTITTVAGDGTQGFSDDGGPATNASLNLPTGVAVDAAGNLYFPDPYSNRVRKVSTSGTITTVAGNGTFGFSGDGGPATNASLRYPYAVAVNAAGNLYIADQGNNRVRKVAASVPPLLSGTITTVAGDGTTGFSGDGGPATNASLYEPTGVAVDAAGNVYIADPGNHRVRKVSTSGTITTVAGNGSPGFSGDGGPATNASLDGLRGVAVDAAGNLYIADWVNSRVRKVSTSGMITTVAGSGTYGFSGDGGPATDASLSSPYGVAVDAAGNLYIADAGNSRVRKVSTSGTITTVAGSGTYGFSGDGGPATNAALSSPQGVALDAAGNLYIADAQDTRVRKVSTSGTITTVAGSGTYGFSGDGGPATDAGLKGPTGVAVDAAGNLYIADPGNHRVRKVSTSGTITTVAGNGTQGFSGDAGPATNASLNTPYGVAVDAAGNLYIADPGNNRVRKVSVPS
jgi:hypothetical protein